MKLFQLHLIMNTLKLLSPHCLSQLSLGHHPLHSIHVSKALTSGSTNYSTTPLPILTCSVYQKYSKPTPRSSLHLTDPSLLLSDPRAGPAPYLMASILPQTMDLYSAVFHHPSVLKHMGSSPFFDSRTELANTLNPPCPSKTSSTPTPQV